MSIIERAAELLGALPQGRRKSTVPENSPGGGEGNWIERAAAEEDARLRSGSPKVDPARRPAGTHEPTRSGDRAGRTLAIDRSLLRQQSMIAPDGERTVIAESFRRIKRQILANVAKPKAGPPANLVLVTSALPGEGKTYCAINLAISIALEVDRTALLVDGDVAKPDVARLLGLDAQGGLMEVLRDRSVDVADVLCKTDIGRLTILPAGAAHKRSTELMASDAMRDLLHDLAGRYPDRIIIFDSPPLLAASETGVLASQMGQIVIVVEAGKTSETALKSALQHVDAGKVSGLLLNKGQSASLEYGYDGYG